MNLKTWLSAAALAALALGAGHGEAPAGSEHAARAADMVSALDLDLARHELDLGSEADAAIAIERARLAIYNGDYDRAVAILGRPDLAKSDEGAMLGDIARGSARVTAATVVVRDDASDVEVRYQDEADNVLGPMLVETIARARESLTRDLGVSWTRPTRVVVVRDLHSLSAMTGLPYASARTTGTVAVAKWGRVTLLSPRASRHGFAWRDTVAHEMAHLAVTHATADRAPLWLQEGVAKRQEMRWREPGPFDDRPSPDALLARGIELKLDLPLDKLGASIAMLPSAAQAMIAYAEVTSFVRYYAETAGDGALPRLLAALRSGRSPNESLVAESGDDLKAWDAKWRAALAKKPREPLPAAFDLGGEKAEHRDLRERVRLAELLFGRAHTAEALKELDRLQAKDAEDDPSLRHLRATVLDAVGRRAAASAAVGEPRDIVTAYGPWWAIRGRFLGETGNLAGAEKAFWEALANDPLDVECACGVSAGTSGMSSDLLSKNNHLCDAARERGEPLLGRD